MRDTKAIYKRKNTERRDRMNRREERSTTSRDAERKQLNTEGGAVDQHKRARESAAADTGGARGITCWGRREKQSGSSSIQDAAQY